MPKSFIINSVRKLNGYFFHNQLYLKSGGHFPLKKSITNECRDLECNFKQLKKTIKNIIAISIFFCITNILFAQTNKIDSVTSKGHKLNLEYNVMDSITLENPGRYKNKERYKLIEKGIYLDLKDNRIFNHRMTISYIQGSRKTNHQYPLEDILDKYLLYVSHKFSTKKNKFKIELGGDLDHISKAKNEIIGKKVFNRDSIGTGGKIYVGLVIE